MSAPDRPSQRPKSGSRKIGATAVIVGFSVLLALLQPGVAAAESIPAPTVPANLLVPAGNVPYLVGHARGYQIYTCQAVDGGYGWVLLAPWAGLFDDAGNAVATHYAGPSWTAADGTTVVGTRVASAPAPSGDAIPWLLLRASSTTAPTTGTLSSTTYIQRINTTGGLAPAGGCDAAHVGAVFPSYYTADYYFYRSG